MSAKEREKAFKFLALEAQDGIKFRDTTLDHLVIQKEESAGLIVCGGRIQCWNEDKVAVPLIPSQSWLATLLIREAHGKNHEGICYDCPMNAEKSLDCTRTKIGEESA